MEVRFRQDRQPGVECFGWDCEAVGGVVAEAFDLLGDVREEIGELLPGDLAAFGGRPSGSIANAASRAAKFSAAAALKAQLSA